MPRSSSEAAVRSRKAVAVSQSAGSANTAVVLTAVAAAALGWFWWRRRRDTEAEQGSKRSRPGKALGGRSRFSFGRALQPKQSAAAAPAASVPGHNFRPAVAPATKAGGRRVNAKKDKGHRCQQKDEKAARKAGQAAAEILNSRGIGKEEEGPAVYKYVDMSKTADIYDRVREYLETGKKKF